VLNLGLPRPHPNRCFCGSCCSHFQDQCQQSKLLLYSVSGHSSFAKDAELHQKLYLTKDTLQKSLRSAQCSCNVGTTEFPFTVSLFPHLEFHPTTDDYLCRSVVLGTRHWQPQGKRDLKHWKTLGKTFLTHTPKVQVGPSHRNVLYYSKRKDGLSELEGSDGYSDKGSEWVATRKLHRKALPANGVGSVIHGWSGVPCLAYHGSDYGKALKDASDRSSQREWVAQDDATLGMVKGNNLIFWECEKIVQSLTMPSPRPIWAHSPFALPCLSVFKTYVLTLPRIRVDPSCLQNMDVLPTCCWESTTFLCPSERQRIFLFLLVETTFKGSNGMCSTLWPWLQDILACNKVAERGGFRVTLTSRSGW
jgi:hypothetical protein